MKSTKNLVLSFATNMKSDRMRVLAQSLRQVYAPEDCDLVIYTNQVDKELHELAEKFSVNFMYTENLYTYELSNISKVLIRAVIYPMKWLAKNLSFIPSLKLIFHGAYPSLVKLWCHPQLVRWLYFRDFLRTHRDYNKILMTDVKDVLFQAPFFESVSQDKLYFTEQGMEYGSENWDTVKYRQAFGSNELKKVMGRPALCCATVMGGFRAVEQFLDTFCSEILSRPVGRTTDQVIFNYCYQSTAYPGIEVELYKNYGNPVLHAVHPKQVEEDFEVTDHGIFRKDGQPVPVIHCWDRDKTIFNSVATRFRVRGPAGYSGGYTKR